MEQNEFRIKKLSEAHYLMQITLKAWRKRKTEEHSFKRVVLVEALIHGPFLGLRRY
jgi:hypothetical protein